MGYVYLAIAILCELVGTLFLKSSKGFTVPLHSIGVLISYGICFFFFSKSLLTVNLNIGYATWSGIGIVAAALISAFIFKQGLTAMGILGIALVVSGVIILNFFGTAH